MFLKDFLKSSFFKYIAELISNLLVLMDGKFSIFQFDIG